MIESTQFSVDSEHHHFYYAENTLKYQLFKIIKFVESRLLFGADIYNNIIGQNYIPSTYVNRYENKKMKIPVFKDKTEAEKQTLEDVRFEERKFLFYSGESFFYNTKCFPYDRIKFL